MRDYSKMTKAELVALLQEQIHLGQAVEAKDKEIVTLRKELDKLSRGTVAKEVHDNLVAEMKNMLTKEKAEELKEKLKLFEGSLKKEDLDKLVKRIEEEKRSILEIANAYRDAFKDLMKISKVALDMSITRDDLLSEKYKLK